MKEWLRRVIGIPSQGEAERRATTAAMARRDRVRRLSERSFSEVDGELGVNDIGRRDPGSGYLTPAHYSRRARVSDKDSREAENVLAER